MRPNTLKKFVFILPLLVIALWIGKWQLKVLTGLTVSLPIEGYDPRDLLSGHYLQYSVNYGQEVKCKDDGPMHVCLKSDGEFHSVYQQDTRRERLSCQIVLSGQCDGNRFLAGIERFYFPEIYRKELREVPRNASIDVKISASGKGVATQLKVEGFDVFEWLDRQEM
ncbi:MAG: GDYXXLXY domain-containing protein [Oligoflexales bacterium]|nr:GDYXXLXY domain-containing protein [Oligoflexales bacterium]